MKGLTNKKEWDKYVEKNTDPYGKACVDVARRVMELLDEDLTPLKNGYLPDIHTAHGLICQADKDVKAGGISGFMTSCVAQMVFTCLERGEEFKESHNGERKADGVINHAVMEIKPKNS